MIFVTHKNMSCERLDSLVYLIWSMFYKIRFFNRPTKLFRTSRKAYFLTLSSINKTFGNFLKKQHVVISRSKACVPHLKKSSNPHILNLSPPLNMAPMWFQNHLAYTISKYGMSMCALGMAEEFQKDGIAVNALWPKTSKLPFNTILSRYQHYKINNPSNKYLAKSCGVFHSNIIPFYLSKRVGRL